MSNMSTGSSEELDDNIDSTGLVAAMSIPKFKKQKDAAVRDLRDEVGGKENVEEGTNLEARGSTIKQQRSFDTVAAGAHLASMRLGGEEIEFKELKTRDRPKLRMLLGLDHNTMPDGLKVTTIEESSKKALDATWNHIGTFLKTKILQIGVLHHCLSPTAVPALVKTALIQRLIKNPPLYSLFHVQSRSRDGRIEWTLRWWKNYILDKVVDQVFHNVVKILKQRYDRIMSRSGHESIINELKRKKTVTTPGSNKRRSTTSRSEITPASTPYQSMQLTQADELALRTHPLQPAATPTPVSSCQSGGLYRSTTEDYSSQALIADTSAFDLQNTPLEPFQGMHTQHYAPNSAVVSRAVPQRTPLQPLQQQPPHPFVDEVTPPWFAPSGALPVNRDGVAASQRQPYPIVPYAHMSLASYYHNYDNGQQ